MIRKLLLSVAFDEIAEAREVALPEGLGIEVTLYDTSWMMGDRAVQDARRAGEGLAEDGILVTTHGPLYDLNPGSLDPTIRTYTRDCFLRGVEVAAALGGEKIVFHTCYNPLLPDGVLPGWKQLAVPVWDQVQDLAEERGVTVCLENSYEPSAEFFKDLFTAFMRPSGSICFDPAHVHLYSNDGQSSWVVTLGDRIDHLHLNDNGGSSDDHLALDAGSIPYASFLSELCEACSSSTVVLEMTIERALRSLGFMRRIGVLDG